MHKKNIYQPKVLPDSRIVNKGNWRKTPACWNETSRVFAIRRPGEDMSLILMHFYVSPIVLRDAWRNQDEIPQWFSLHCIKTSGCHPKTDAFWKSQVIYDLFYVNKIKVSCFYTQFLIKSKLDLSALLALCCSCLLSVTLYFIAFYMYTFFLYFCLATKDSLFSLLFYK